MMESDPRQSEPADPDCVEGNIQTRPVNLTAELNLQDDGSAARSNNESMNDTSALDYKGLSEDLETRGSRATERFAFTVKDIKEEQHGVLVKFDNGSEYTYISPETVQLYNLSNVLSLMIIKSLSAVH